MTYYLLKQSVKVDKTDNPDTLRLTDTNNNKTYSIGQREIQLFQLLAKMTPQQIKEKSQISEQTIDSFINFFKGHGLLEESAKPLEAAAKENAQHSQETNDRNSSAPAIQIREDIDFEQDGDSLLIEDPISNRFFRLEEEEASIFHELAQKPISIVSQEREYSERELLAFIRSLAAKKILSYPHFPDIEAAIAPRTKSILGMISNHVKLCDPDSFLGKLDRSFGWLWKGPMFFVHVGLMLWAIGLWIQYGSVFQSITKPQLTNSPLLDMLMFLGVVSSILALHEMAHGLTLKSFGGRVPEMGVFLMYGLPSAYTNVSSSYKLKSKSQKVWVILAGILFQAWVGCMAFVIWHYAYSDTFIAKLAHYFVIGAFFNLVINLNPLIKLDGYYLLTTILEKPNLRTRAWDFMKSGFRGASSFNEGILLLTYGVLSIAYTVFLIGLIAGIILHYSFENIPFTSIFIAALLFLAAKTPLPRTQNLEQAPSNTNNTTVSPKTKTSPHPPMQKQATATASKDNSSQAAPSRGGGGVLLRNLLVIALLIILLNIKIPYKIGGQVEVKTIPSQTSVIYSPIEGIIENAHAKTGDYVRAGQLLLEIKSWALLEQFANISGTSALGYSPRLNSVASQIRQAGIGTQKLRVQLQQSKIDLAEKIRKAKLYTKLSRMGAFQHSLAEEARAQALVSRQEINRLQQEINLNNEMRNQASSDYHALSGQINLYKEKAGLQKLTSPIDGYVLSQDIDLEQGLTTSPMQKLLTIADLKQIEIRIKVLQEDLASVHEGQKVNLMIRAFPDKIFEGEVSEISIASEDTTKLDPSTSSQSMVDIGRKRWNVKVIVDNDQSEQLLRPGMTGYAYIGSHQEMKISKFITRELYRIFPMDRFLAPKESLK